MVRIMKKKILIVDDEMEVCNLIKDVLKTEGFEAEAVYSGKDCIEKVKANGYNLVILDIMMPDLSGSDVLGILRKDGKKIPVIYVTVVPRDDVDTKRVSGFVQKPFKNEDLIKTVKKAIGG